MFPSVEQIENEEIKRRLEGDVLEFLIWIFNKVKKEEFLSSWHHRVIADTLMKVYRGELTHVIINLPPRYTKTELVIKGFVAWCLAKNPKCKFIHLSYSDDLALDNSSAIREMVTSDEYQAVWPMEMKKDSDAKKKWFNADGGGVYATATGGQITGFGAGAVTDHDINGDYVFSGAILIDDPLKPDDASSDTIRNRINGRFNSTIKSRTNSNNTPIIIIMQRLHEDDMAGFLLDMGSEFDFYHLNLPALNEDGPSENDPRERGEALWPRKHDEEALEAMRIADAGTFAGQMQQRPAPEEGNIFKWFKYYKELPEDQYYKIHSWDLTFKAKSKNKNGTVDYVVGTEWGKGRLSKDIYLFPDMVRARMGFTDTKDSIERFCMNHPDFKAVLIEDKANGSAIMDSIKNQIKRVIAIEPSGDKVERAEAVAPMFKAGDVYLPDPSICPWIVDFVNELKIFPNGKHDDQVDSCTQALEYLEQVGNNYSMGDVNKPSTRFNNAFDKKKKGRPGKSRIRVNSF